MLNKDKQSLPAINRYKTCKLRRAHLQENCFRHCVGGKNQVIKEEIYMAISEKEVALILSDHFDANEFNGLHSCLSKEGALIGTVGETAGQKLSDADHKTEVEVEVSYEEARSYNFDGVVIFDGHSSDTTRMDEDALMLILDMYNSGKIIGAIDHGALVLINLDVLKDKNVTGSPSIRVDLENAGARYFDEPVVIDGNLVTGRGPQDLEDFCQALVDELRRLTEFAA